MIDKVHNGQILEVMSRIESESIDAIITSPPYWQKRDYGFSDQWGMELTYQEYLERLWQFMDEAFRVLKKTGTCWINLGDSYSKSAPERRQNDGDKSTLESAKSRYMNELRKQRTKFKRKVSEPGKCLLFIPHRFAIGCIERGWIARNDIIWGKRNGIPESMQDRFTVKKEYFFFFVKARKYYFDLDGVRNAFKESTLERISQDLESQEGPKLPGKTNANMKAVFKGSTKISAEQAQDMKSPRARKYRDHPKVGGQKYDGQQRYGGGGKSFVGHSGYFDKDGNFIGNINGSNPGDVSDFWDITTKGKRENHFAAYNDELIERPIIAGCPEGGIVLDPFCGTGTTLKRAKELGRRVIGIDGNAEYCRIADKQIRRIPNSLFNIDRKE